MQSITKTAHFSFEDLYHLVDRGLIDCAGIKEYALRASIINHANGTVLDCAAHPEDTCFLGLHDGIARVEYREEKFEFQYPEPDQLF